MRADPGAQASAGEPPNSFEAVRALFYARGTLEGYGEGLSVREHMLQCAALAVRARADDALVVAALLHDLGWALGEGAHDIAAADRLEPLLGAAVTGPIRLHVSAKRYLVAREPAYLEHLSGASVQSLSEQGGAMTDAECDGFERHPGFHAAIRLRRFDDEAKVVGLQSPPFEAYTDRLHTMLEARLRVGRR
jgi:predicted HD phosphohydrolase